MRTIIAGSRSIIDLKYIVAAVKESTFDISVIIEGEANGVDVLVWRYGMINNIPVEPFLAKWNEFGKSAGYKRNVEMANNAEALILVWDGKSKGSKHMLDVAKTKGLKTFVYIPEEYQNNIGNELV